MDNYRHFTFVLLLLTLWGCEERLIPQHEISVVSSRADFVTGGDLLLNGLPDGVELMVGEQSLSTTRLGKLTMVSGIPVGEQEIVGYSDGDAVARITVTNYPAQGPVIAGPHETPFFCQTNTFEVGPGLGTLSPSQPPLCVVPPRRDKFIVKDGQYQPGELSGAVTVDTGVVNRAIYQLAMPASWNGRLVYKFGGGCRGGWYVQGDRTAGVLDEFMLSRGYAVASATLNVFGVNCNDLLAAETMMMVKEKFIETWGEPDFTMGFGCSGGSYQAHQIGDNYPGLLDGILVGCSFPEVGHAMVTVLADARLLKRYFDWANEEAGVTWSEAQQLAVSGLPSLAALETTANGAARIVSAPIDGWPAAEFREVVDQRQRYYPFTHTDGARPTVFDHTVNVYGRDPKTGAARWPFDNRGIRYGLGAMEDGVISPAQFAHLNHYIGGFDRDGRFSVRRTAHDPEATRAAYETGRVLDGGQGLASIPIIDYRAWSDGRETGDTHLEYHTYSTRERLRAANGNIDNHVVLTEDGLCEGCSLFSLESDVLASALEQLDQWIGGVKSDTTPSEASEKVRRHRPRTLVDACWIEGEKVEETQQLADGRCNEAFPTWGFPRSVAGAPIANNIIACARRPFRQDDVAGMTTEQAAMFQETFKSGICDWNQPGEQQVRATGTWWQAPLN